MKQLPKISSEVLALSLVGAVILGYLCKLLLTRIIGHILEVSLGLLLAFGIYVFILTWTPDKDTPTGNDELLVIPKYSFTKLDNWSSELISLSGEKPIPSAVFPDSFVLSDSIDGLLELIIRDFIQSWYSKLSSDKVFSSSVDNLLRNAIKELGVRLSRIEIPELLVGTIIPLVTEHFSNYVEATSVIKDKSSGGHLTQSNELDSEIASEYRDKFQPSSLMSKLFISKNFEYENTRKRWLNRKIAKIMPFLFKKEEIESKIVNILLIEIISNSILLPILKMTSDSDFWNQIVMKSAGSTIQDQNKVKRLRQALSQHTGKNTITSNALRFSPNSDQNKFDKFIRNIYKCQSLAEARQTRYYISVQLQRAVKEGNDKVFIRRLEQGKAAIETQISILSGEQLPIDAVSSISSLVPTSTVLNSMGRSSPVPMLRSPKIEQKRTSFSPTTTGSTVNVSAASASTSTSTPASASTPATPATPNDDYSLLDLLNDPPCSLYFMEYMEQKRHTDLLQFWLTVNSLRKQDEHIHDIQQQDPLGGLNVVSEGDEPAEDNPNNHLFIDDGTSKDDIVQIYSKFFINLHKIKEITPESFQNVSDFINNIDNATISQYKQARNSILSTQNEVYNTLEIKYLPRFKKSDLYLKYLASNPPPINRINSTIDNLQLDAITNDDSNITYGTVLDRSQNAKVVLAVEEAFQDIMSGSGSVSVSAITPNGDKGKPKKRVIKSGGLSELISEEFETAKKKRDSLFDSDDEQLGGKKKQREALFDSENDFEYDSDQTLDFSIPANPDVRLASPGDLGLTEAISILSNEIDNLYNQEEVVNFLLKKAELTNNQSQLRILQKSKSSLEREIHRKELQRQQYIVQESENSLFGKSDIQIQSYVHGVEDGGEYILYIIEVRKLDIEGNQTSGWIVARRYSQFFDLHQHLKEQFPIVRKLDFPRKRVLLKFQQPKSLVDSRRISLEKYLKELLKVPEVCQSKAFRLFLSSETFSVDSLSGPSHSPMNSPGPSVSNSLSNSMVEGEDSVVPPKRILEMPDNQDIATKLSSTKRSLFIQPICDLFIIIFGINAGDNWLRGRAVVVVIQQLLGGTVEKKFRETISSLTSVKSIIDMIQTVRDSVWPGGILKEPSPVRTQAEKIKTRHEAMILLQQLIHNASARVIGGSSSRYAARNIFGMYQNEILNTHLVYNLFDLIIKEIFPELNDG